MSYVRGVYLGKKTKYSGINGDDNRTTDKEGPLIIHMCRGGNKSMIYL